MLASRSGRRRNGLSAGVMPPSTMWLPPPVPTWRPSSMNFSAPRPHLRGFLVDGGGDVDRLLPGGRRVHVDLDHAGVGRDLDVAEARVVRAARSLPGGRAGRLAAAACSMAATRAAIVLAVGERRQEHAQVAVARLDGQRRAHGLLRPPRAVERPAASSEHMHAAGSARLLGERIGRQHVRESPAAAISARQASGSRRPIGESPGSRNRCPRRNAQRSVTPAPALPAGLARQERQHDSRPACRSPCSKTRIRRLRSRRIGELVVLGVDAERQLLLDQHEVRRVLVGGDRRSRRQPERAAELGGESARRRPPSPATCGVSTAIRSGSRQSGSPSVRQ